MSKIYVYCTGKDVKCVGKLEDSFIHSFIHSCWHCNIFSQMNKTLRITTSWFLWMTSCFHEILSQESAYRGIRWAPGKENSIRFLGTVTSYKALLGNFHLKSSMKCFQKKSLRLTIWSVLRKKSQSDLLKQWPHDTPMTTFLLPRKTQFLQNIPRRNLYL